MFKNSSSVTPYTESCSLPSLSDFGDCRVLCTFNKIPAAAGIVRSSQLSSPLPGQAVQQDLAGGTARPSQYSPSISLQLVRAGRRVGSVLYPAFGLYGDDTVLRNDMHYVESEDVRTNVCYCMEITVYCTVYCVLRVPLGRKIHCVDGI